MSLWDIIRDFFVQYIFGGLDSTGNMHNISLGQFASDNFNYVNIIPSEGINGFLPVNMACDMDWKISYISFGDWLSTTATIITLCAICVFLFFFVRWLFRLTAGLISGRG